ncbi:hypothetical protein [Leisingera caerulea]|uniref:hypothetical protein n=1 Tax=Leisingera caerulea TaxID=506591 RepID=UPI0003FC9A32|nr:hypothetical protein [Leisingera caerulea]
MSELGDQLELERQRIFFRRFAILVDQRGDIKPPDDRKFISEMIEKITAAKGNFAPSIEEFTKASVIEDSLKKADRDYTALTERYLAEAEPIIKNGVLPSGRLSALIELVDAAAEKPLSPQQVDLLQYLILEAKWIKGEDLDE